MILEKNTFRKFALGFATAVEVFAYTMSGFGIGYFFDRQVGVTAPWLTVLFLLMGFIGGFYRLYKTMLKADQADLKVEQEEKK